MCREDKKETLEAVIQKKGTLVLTAEGVSMLPCIRPKKDVLILARPDRNICPREVILYKRSNGAYVLHRVLEVRESGYVLCGDNQYRKEYGIQNQQVLGILEGFYRGHQYVDCKSSKGYQRYVKVWCCSMVLRRFAVWAINIGRRIGKR